MAEHGINLALLRLYERFRIKAKQGVSTIGVKLVGAMKRNDIEGLAQQLTANSSLTLATCRHLVHTYGAEAQEILEITRQGRQLLQSELVEDLPNIGAEIVYAARYEMTMTLADALARRTRLLMLDGAKALTCASFVANLMARELGWDEKEIKRQLALLRNEYALEYAFD
jgi:glycerol-3-phosphate dehydrogenase